MTIFVGSTNPVKCNAVVLAASETWPEVSVKGFEVPSGVAAQPRSDAETRQGAEQRAKLALEAGLADNSTAADAESLGVGLEGGVFEQPNGELWSTVWVAVTDQSGQVWTANGARFQVPEPIAAAIRSGQEMGPAVSQLTGIADLRKRNGMIGVVTQDFTDRTEEYSGIAKLALGLWYGRDWAKQLQ